jgi:hypothetical protein
VSSLTPAIELGQVATCTRCGAKSEPAYASRPRDPEVHRAHRALLLEWRNGGRPELMAVVVLPAECPACGREQLGRPRQLAPENAQETFARLESEFERSTGVWAPNHHRPGDEDDGLTEPQRVERFRAWLQTRFGDGSHSTSLSPKVQDPLPGVKKDETPAQRHQLSLF